MKRLLAMLLGLVLAPATHAAMPPEWSEPTAPFHVAGNIYYVGTKGLAAYLIVSSRGLILLDGTLAENVPVIERNIEALGYKVRDVRLLLNSHAHYDHAAGLAQLKRDSGASLIASAGDRGALETGQPPSDTDYGVMAFPPVKVDRTLVDGRPVRLGNVTMTPVLTPGHTPGCTTWMMNVTDNGRRLKVVFLGSITVAGNRLVGNRGYPAIVADYRDTFRRVAGLHADIVLPAHPDLVGVIDRARRSAAGDKQAFLMPGLLQKLDAESVKDFDAELAKEQATR